MWGAQSADCIPHIVEKTQTLTELVVGPDRASRFRPTHREIYCVWPGEVSRGMAMHRSTRD